MGLQDLTLESRNYGVVKEYANRIISYSTLNDRRKWESISINGTFEIFDQCLQNYFIELEFPLKICPQVIFLSNELKSGQINLVSIKDDNTGEWTVVWDKNQIKNNTFEHILSLNVVTFKTNQIRCKLEDGDISAFLSPFAIEIQGAYSNDEIFLVDSYDCSKLLKDDKFTDVEFLVKNESIKAHKCILAMRTSYWNENFETDGNKPIIVENTSPEAFKIFLKYLYTNKISESHFKPEWICELYMLSNQCRLVELKDISYSEFCNFLHNPYELMDMYSIVLKYGIRDLIDNCLETIAFNFEAIVDARCNSLK